MHIRNFNSFRFDTSDKLLSNFGKQTIQGRSHIVHTNYLIGKLCIPPCQFDSYHKGNIRFLMVKGCRLLNCILHKNQQIRKICSFEHCNWCIAWLKEVGICLCIWNMLSNSHKLSTPKAYSLKIKSLQFDFLILLPIDESCALLNRGKFKFHNDRPKSKENHGGMIGIR